MKVSHVVGIDPGLVHTGVVCLTWDVRRRRVVISHEVITGLDVSATKSSLSIFVKPRVFIEKYQPRSHFSGDARMVAGVAQLHQAIPGSKVILNTGVKKVIRQELMKALNVWTFKTTTNHQDLRSAAYIALYGMVKDPELNLILAEFTKDYIEGRPWYVTVS